MMSELIRVLIFIISGSALLSGCANPVGPRGGPKDEAPPEIIWEESTQNIATNFDQKEIILTFNEFVELKDPTTQIVTSPPLEFPIRSEARKEEVRVIINEREELKPNTTYTINFGAAVQDYTEGNSAENVRFIFSTGNSIDSGRINFHLLDFTTRQPVEDAVAMLFEPSNDTAALKGLPYYFGTSGEQGFVELSYLREGSYKTVALKEESRNYLFDQPEEYVGFLDTLVYIDSSVATMDLFLFRQILYPIVVDAFRPYPGAYFFTVSGDQSALEILQDTAVSSISYTDLDTLKWWIESPVKPRTFIFSSEDEYRDTFSVRGMELRDTILPGLEPVNPINGGVVSIYPNISLRWIFNVPINSVDIDRIGIIDTGGTVMPVPPSVILETDKVFLDIGGLDNIDIARQLIFYPGAVKGFRDLQNTDTLNFRLNTKTPEKLSNLNLTVNNLDSTAAYGIELLKAEEVIREVYVSNVNAYTWEVPSLEPIEYEVRLYKDENGNGKYDHGNFRLKRYPEPIIIKVINNLRPNWDIEDQITVDNMF